MYTCANCTVLACANNAPEKMPKNCPMRNASVMEAARAGYDLPENHDFYVNCSAIEGLGYCQWPRLKETVEFCKRMGYHKLGLAFCKGLRKEARIVADLLRAQGFEVVSVICKTGGISKEEVGIPEEVKIHPGEFEAMCNPIAQAKLLNEQHTDFNIEVGLCVGHDSMFYKYSDAMVTTLVAKDRVLAHNPCGAIYCAEGVFQKTAGIIGTMKRAFSKASGERAFFAESGRKELLVSYCLSGVHKNMCTNHAMRQNSKKGLTNLCFRCILVSSSGYIITD